MRLEVDGGVKPDNIGEIAAAGADTFVAGSAIFGQADYAEVVRRLRAELRRLPDSCAADHRGADGRSVVAGAPVRALRRTALHGAVVGQASERRGVAAATTPLRAAGAARVNRTRATAACSAAATRSRV